MEARDDVLVVLMTAPAGEPAARLARALVAERLAACVNRVPGAVSLYRWQGKLEEEQEELLFIKTAAGALATLKKRALELHPASIPELVVLPVAGGSGPYLDWVRGQVAPARGPASVDAPDEAC